MILGFEITDVGKRIMWAAAIALSATGCQTNPMFWTDGTKVDILSDRSFVVSLASERVASLGGPASEVAQEFVLARLKENGCVPTAPIGTGANAWGGYWYAKGNCR